MNAAEVGVELNLDEAMKHLRLGGGANKAAAVAAAAAAKGSPAGADASTDSPPPLAKKAKKEPVDTTTAAAAPAAVDQSGGVKRKHDESSLSEAPGAAAPLAVVVRYHLKLRRCRCGGRSRALRRSLRHQRCVLLLPPCQLLIHVRVVGRRSGLTGASERASTGLRERR